LDKSPSNPSPLRSAAQTPLHSPPGVSPFLRTGDRGGRADAVHSSILGASPCAHPAPIPAGRSRWERMGVTWVSQSHPGRGGEALWPVQSRAWFPEQFHGHTHTKLTSCCALQMTWMGSWESCPRISSQPRLGLTAAEPSSSAEGDGAEEQVAHLAPPTCCSLCVSVVFVRCPRCSGHVGPSRSQNCIKGSLVSASPVSSCVTPVPSRGPCSPWVRGAVPPGSPSPAGSGGPQVPPRGTGPHPVTLFTTQELFIMPWLWDSIAHPRVGHGPIYNPSCPPALPCPAGFAFSPSALRSLRLQRELLERDDRRRALARASASRRLLPGTPRAPPSPPRRRQFCRDPAVHNALYAGDLPRVQSIFRDEASANLVLEMVSEELVWSPEQGMGLAVELGSFPSSPFPPVPSAEQAGRQERGCSCGWAGGSGAGCSGLWGDGESGPGWALRAAPRAPQCSPQLRGGWGGAWAVRQPPLTPAGLWVLSPRRQHTSALRIAAARGYEDCARHLLLRGAAVDAVVGGRAPLHDSAAAPHPNCARLLLAFAPTARPRCTSAPRPTASGEGLTCGGPHLRPGWGSLHEGPTESTPLPHPRNLGARGLCGFPGGGVPGGAVPGGVPRVTGHSRLSLGVSHGNHISLARPGRRPLTLPTRSRCAELLLAHGARVNLGTRDRQVTALHVAARHGLVAHVELYLHHGADPSRRTHQGETPLNAAAAAAERPEDAERFLRVAERLLAAGARAGAAGRKGHTPLHNACANGHPALARLLLRHGADAAVPNGAGDTPMDCALRAVPEYREQRPEETLALLLDHGALPAHPKVGHGAAGGAGSRRGHARLCCQHPPALEVMLNAYDRVPPADGWAEAVTGCPGGSWAVPVSPSRPAEPRVPPRRSTSSSTPRPCAWRGGRGGCSTWHAWPSGATWAPAATPLSPSWRCHPPCAATSSCPSRVSSPEGTPCVPAAVPFVRALHAPHRCPLAVSPPCP
ncbi:hypothetical protein DV515_00019176, partial [Chloebia gouldiae]